VGGGGGVVGVGGGGGGGGGKGFFFVFFCFEKEIVGHTCLLTKRVGVAKLQMFNS